jgi:hypothetical protein
MKITTVHPTMPLRGMHVNKYEDYWIYPHDAQETLSLRAQRGSPYLLVTRLSATWLNAALARLAIQG